MTVSDYIIEFLVDKGITDVFGYPGGMVTHFMNSLAQHSDVISAHLTYHEQAAAFAACGYAQSSGKPGVAYATSGPGATNLITGICNAYFDSTPAIFITGNVNKAESKGEYAVRQRGFQETDIVSMVKPVTKYASYIEDASKLPDELNKAYVEAISGRKGPVLLDIPMNVFRSDIDNVGISNCSVDDCHRLQSDIEIDQMIVEINTELKKSDAPVIIVGNGVKIAGVENEIRALAEQLRIPVVSSMVAFDVMRDSKYYYGFIGAYGDRSANFIVAKSDLIISIGTRLDIRQVGADREQFAPEAKIIRFDVDCGELSYNVHDDEIHFCTDMDTIVNVMNMITVESVDCTAWLSVCDEIRDLLCDIDNRYENEIIDRISQKVPDGVIITTDVGQNQVWIAQSFKIKSDQKVLFSGGHGAMGYSLPAAIGAYYGAGKGKPVFCFTGDGGLQMNIQELQFVVREKIPIKIIVLNNNSLGMIRHFQELYYDGCYYQTKPEGGYTAPNFSEIAKAYGIMGVRLESTDPISFDCINEPALYEMIIQGDTYVTPKLEFGKPNQDQMPPIDRAIYDRIMSLNVK